jgi:hypothetical protein
MNGIIFLHRSACDELPSTYKQLSDEAKAELLAAFEMTELDAYIRKSNPPLFHL